MAGSETERDGDSDSVTVMRLKLELAREERERERERHEMMEREWQIEKERAELGLHASQTAVGVSRSNVRGDLSHLLPRMHDNDPVVFFFCF